MLLLVQSSRTSNLLALSFLLYKHNRTNLKRHNFCPPPRFITTIYRHITPTTYPFHSFNEYYRIPHQLWIISLWILSGTNSKSPETSCVNLLKMECTVCTSRDGATAAFGWLDMYHLSTESSEYLDEITVMVVSHLEFGILLAYSSSCSQ